MFEFGIFAVSCVLVGGTIDIFAFVVDFFFYIWDLILKIKNIFCTKQKVGNPQQKSKSGPIKSQIFIQEERS